MRREFEAADDGADFRLTNDRKDDEKDKKLIAPGNDDGLDREFADIPGPIIGTGAMLPSEITAKIANDSAKIADTERLEIDLDLDDDLVLGIKVNDKLYVEGFKKMGTQESKFTIGDQIIAVNGKLIRSAVQFFRLLHKYGPHVRVSVFRPMLTTRAHPYRLHKHGITEAKIRTNFPDDQFLVVHVSYRPGVHLGLSVNSYDKVVVISRVDKNSLASMRFEVGDMVLDVDGDPVRDKQEFRNLMMDAVDRNSYVSVLIQRPLSPESCRIAKMALGQTQRDPLDPPLPHDVMMIGRREMQRFKANELKRRPVVKPVLNESPKGGQHLAISEEKPLEYSIQSDIPDGKKLSPCPTRAQLHARLKARLAKKNKKQGPKGEVMGTLVRSTEGPAPDITPSPPVLITAPTPAPQVEVKSVQSESLLQRAQDSWRERKSRIFSSSKKNTDSDSSSRRVKRKGLFFGSGAAEKEQGSDRKNSNSEKSKKDANDRRLKDDSSDKRRKDENRDQSERNRVKDDSGKKKKQQR